ncbi:MAG TPA: tetratricopeptide repeat protein [Polyangiaceae bacterium]|nr:tetratricopeptide repeat protein [Polyangiaceae bacterium]
MRRIAWAAIAFSAGCAARPGDAFTRAKNAGDRAYSAGRYGEAAGAYGDAHDNADRPRDRSEARYLEAAAFRRERDFAKARAAYAALVAEAPASERGRRARFDLADLEVEAGNAALGHDLLREALLEFPNEGLAHRSLERYIRHLDAGGHDALGFLRGITPRFAATELDETVRYQIAVRLEAASRWAEARDAFAACADLHPYPRGNLFDDALWHASLLDEKLGQPSKAIERLRGLLSVREPSTMTGSYERPRFSAAQFRIAELYRDKLGDRPSARREFHRLYAEHTTSILRDDALWQEAKLAREDGDAKNACALATTLAKEFPASRFTACAPAICPTAPPTTNNCHAYVVRSPTRGD